MTRKKVEEGMGLKLPPFSQQCRECGIIAHTTRFVRGTGGANKPPYVRSVTGSSELMRQVMYRRRGESHELLK